MEKSGLGDEAIGAWGGGAMELREVSDEPLLPDYFLMVMPMGLIR